MQCIYSKLESASGWDSNNDITISGVKYRRMKSEDATDVWSNGYEWSDTTTYHYFKYEPIKWRVLNVSNGQALLLADKALDDQLYNSNYKDITWEKSTIRSWLNGYSSDINTDGIDYSGKNFIDSAFSSTAQNAIAQSTVINDNNEEKLTYDMSEVLFEDQTVTYDGKEHSLAINGDLPNGVSVSYENNGKTNAGTYTVTAKFTGDTNYADIPDMIATLTVKKATHSLHFASSSVTKTYGDAAFTNELTKQTDGMITYKSSDASIAVVDVTGKVTLKGYGKATITITAAQTSQYSKATKKVTVTVKPKKMSTPSVKLSSKGAIQVSWNKDSKASGYQIRYSTKSSMSGAKIVTIKSTSTVSKKISGLSKGKKYYVQVRAYKSSYYGTWSSAKNIITK